MKIATANVNCANCGESRTIQMLVPDQCPKCKSSVILTGPIRLAEYYILNNREINND